MNKLILSGRLAKEPEITITSNNNKIASLSLAVRRNKEDTDFFNCKAFNNVAETIEKYMHKGNAVLIEGQLITRKWKDKEDKTHIEYEVLINMVEMLGNKGDTNEKNDNGINNHKTEETSVETPKTSKKPIAVSEDELPF